MRLAVAQLVVPVGRDARAQLLTRCRSLLESGADVVVAPEMAVPGYTTDRDDLDTLAEPVPGPTTDALTDLARAADGLIVTGLAEKSGGRFYNTAVAITAGGVIAHYRKLHLFDREKETFAPGDLGLPIAETPFGRIGLCICYDLRFPEVARILALRGAEVICAPAAWVRGFDATPMDVPGQVQGVIVQANLNQVFVACASQVGEPAAHRFLGNSVVVDPFGRIASGPLSADEAAMSLVAVDPQQCEAAQRRSERITPRADRRTDVYGLSYGREQL